MNEPTQHAILTNVGTINKQKQSEMPARSKETHNVGIFSDGGSNQSSCVNQMVKRSRLPNLHPKKKKGNLSLTSLKNYNFSKSP